MSFLCTRLLPFCPEIRCTLCKIATYRDLCKLDLLISSPAPECKDAARDNKCRMYIPQQFPFIRQHHQPKQCDECCDQVAHQHYDSQNEASPTLTPKASADKPRADDPCTGAIKDAEHGDESFLLLAWQNKDKSHEEQKQHDTYSIHYP